MKNVNTEKGEWFQVALRLQGSVIPSVLPRTLICGVFGLFVSMLHHFGFAVSWPTLGTLIPNLVLGLLLVFRTNTAYDRFWEGRKFWGSLNNSIRNLARQIWVCIDERDPEDRETKIAAMRSLVAFAIATKLHLRSEQINNEVEDLLSPQRYEKLKTMNNPPLEIAFWIGDYMQQQYERNRLNIYQLNAMQQLLNDLVDCLGGCERILRTPMPLAYAIHLKQLLLLYCLSLPFQMVKDFGWATGVIVSLVSFTLLGIEAIGLEIENPFGHDANDLPLNTICDNMRRNMEDIITLAPSVRDSQETTSHSVMSQL
jgi:ion channel-forming bestrophin family protein